MVVIAPQIFKAVGAGGAGDAVGYSTQCIYLHNTSNYIYAECKLYTAFQYFNTNDAAHTCMSKLSGCHRL